MAISKRLRFEILRRDNHTCRYCSATDEPLTIDHVIPTTLGGTDDPTNLVAACRDCNAGKSSVPADAPLVDDVAADALRWTRAMRLVAETASVEREARNELHKRFWNEWESWGGQTMAPMPDDWPDTIDRFLQAGLTFGDLLQHLDIAQRKTTIDGYARFKYFCGICYRVLSQRQDAARAVLSVEDNA